MAREFNLAAGDPQHPLTPLPHPDTGELPPDDIFPSTRNELMTLRAEPTDALLQFYGMTPAAGTPHHERRIFLGQVIACRL